MPMTDLLPRTTSTILVVDDTPENLELMAGLLSHEHYRVRVAHNGERALALARAQRPDLILLDIMMPGIDGYAVCATLKADPQTALIPVIFLTAKAEIEDETRGLALGAADYITKPISPPIVLARVRTHLQLKAAADALRQQNARLESEVARRTREIGLTQDVTVQAIASLAETRDNETGNHIRRTQHYVRCLAEHLRDHPERFPQVATQLQDRDIDLLYKSAPLHDIGKVGIPDRILLKPGKLTADEFEVMKTHTTLGHDALVTAEQSLGTELEFLRYAKEITLSHQEKWDGSGYPQGLAGEAIPLSARLMAVADVYDALINRRIYKPPFSHEQAVQIIRDSSGSHFDPALVDAFLAVQDRFVEIARQFVDPE
jgi:putative two-component system response regulator